MNTQTQVNIQQACSDLIARYALAVNQQNADHFVKLFTRDAVWQRPNVPALNGAEEIYTFISVEFSKQRVIRHISGLPVIDIIDESNARGCSQTIVFHLKGQVQYSAVNNTLPEMAVDYTDLYRCVNGQWLFARRDTTVVFIDPNNV